MNSEWRGQGVVCSWHLERDGSPDYAAPLVVSFLPCSQSPAWQLCKSRERFKSAAIQKHDSSFLGACLIVGSAGSSSRQIFNLLLTE